MKLSKAEIVIILVLIGFGIGQIMLSSLDFFKQINLLSPPWQGIQDVVRMVIFLLAGWLIGVICGEEKAKKLFGRK